MADKKQVKNVDILEIIKELKDSDFNEIELEVNKVKLKLSKIPKMECACKQAQHTYAQDIVSNPEEAEVETEIIKEETQDIMTRAEARDDDLLDELVYDPDTTCDLIESGQIRQTSDGRYEYCEG